MAKSWFKMAISMVAFAFILFFISCSENSSDESSNPSSGDKEAVEDEDEDEDEDFGSDEESGGSYDENSVITWESKPGRLIVCDSDCSIGLKTKYKWLGTSGSAKVESGAESDGYWFDVDDHKNGGKSAFTWPASKGSGTTAFNAVVKKCEGVCGEYKLENKSKEYDAELAVGFYLDGDKEPVDISNWSKVCVGYYSSETVELTLGYTDSLEKALDYDMPAFQLPSAKFGKKKCFKLDAFSNGGWGKSADPMEMFRHVVSLKFRYVGLTGDSGAFNIVSVGWNAGKYASSSSVASSNSEEDEGESSSSSESSSSEESSSSFESSSSEESSSSFESSSSEESSSSFESSSSEESSSSFESSSSEESSSSFESSSSEPSIIPEISSSSAPDFILESSSSEEPSSSSESSSSGESSSSSEFEFVVPAACDTCYSLNGVDGAWYGNSGEYTVSFDAYTFHWDDKAEIIGGGEAILYRPTEKGTGANPLADEIDACGGICGAYVLDATGAEDSPFVEVQLLLGTDDSPVDISSWDSVCVSYSADNSMVMRIFGTEAFYTEVLGDVLYYELASGENLKACMAIGDFEQWGWGSVDEATIAGSIENAVSLGFRIQENSASGNFMIYSFGWKLKAPAESEE